MWSARIEKTTLAKALETRHSAVLLSADDWMDALGLDLYDEARRARIEALQWKLGQQLLARGLIVIVEWGTWGDPSETPCERDTRARCCSRTAFSVCQRRRTQRRGMESPPIEREALLRWMEIFQAPAPEEMALFDEPLGAAEAAH